VGTYHVVATSVAAPSSRGSTTVYVVAPAVCTPSAPQSSALPAAQVLALGVHAVGETVSFQVPAGTGSVTLVQQGAEPLAAPSITFQGTSYPNTVVPGSISVNGTLFYNQAVAPPANPATWGGPNGIGSMYFESSSPWTGTATVPNTSNALEYVAANGGVPSGTWSVKIFDYASGCAKPSCTVGDGATKYPPGRYDVKVLLKPGTVGATGAIDVKVYLVTDRYTAASAATDPSMTRMGVTLGTLLAQAGLTMGSLTFVDLPQSVKAQYRTGVDADDRSACGEIATILSMANPGNAMNLFLVNSLVSTEQGGTTIVGIDGTIPGPASVGGTVASGALVSVADLRGGGTAACTGGTNFQGCGADRTAYIATHESGHALGLYHDTEWTGTTFDPVKDTPICDCKVCALDKTNCYAGTKTPTTYQMTNADCTTFPATTCGGGENLMFWLFDANRSSGTLSPEQQRIMRANPLVQ
jgi:hypothetical protein